MHEAALHPESSFVTLTYDDEHLRSPSLEYRDFQLFMKRLRKRFGPTRFFMCGEYGEQTWRPHFHACLFGVFFSDRQVFSSRQGHHLWTSDTLSALWPHGHSTFGLLSYESAAYVARYVVKKITGDAAAEHYQVCDPDSGELVPVVPEFAQMSRRPGIGKPWFAKFYRDVFGQDSVVLPGGLKIRPPRYYRELLDAIDADRGESVDHQRYLKSLEMLGTPGPSLKDRETVLNARLSRNKRKL